MSKKNKDALVLGFALFSMFFGAGNLIFPPYLGLTTGNKWYIAGIAFILTGVGLPMLGVITTAKLGGDVDALGRKVSDSFAKILGILVIVSIGPLLAIPRTAATTYEISVVPLFGDKIPPLVASIVFFAITLYFVFNKSSILDKIGKILTPILIIMICSIIAKAIISPIGELKEVQSSQLFANGFSEGYQTMDALASMFMCSIVINTLVLKGYKDKQQQYKMGKITAIIAGIGLAIVYLGLCYVGATASSVINSDDRTKILITMTTMLLGRFGSYALSIAMLMACLTTSIGLTATVASYFEKLTNNKLNYTALCIGICIFSAIASTIGLNNIIKFSVPVLLTLYPLVIVLMTLSIFDRYIKSRRIYQGSVFGTFLVSIMQSLSSIFTNSQTFTHINDMIESLPFANFGMPFIIPAVVGALTFVICGKVIDYKKHTVKSL